MFPCKGGIIREISREEDGSYGLHLHLRVLGWTVFAFARRGPRVSWGKSSASTSFTIDAELRVRYSFEPFVCDEFFTAYAGTVTAILDALKRGVKIFKEFQLTVDDNDILFSH